MDKQELMRKFPLKGEITKEIIQKANVWDVNNCIGTLTLKETLGENNKEDEMIVKWGGSTGTIYLPDYKLEVTTEEEINMIEVTQPTQVTFTLIQNNMKISELFPVTVMVTENIIEEGKKALMDSTRCIGAIALKSVVNPHIPFDDNEVVQRIRWWAVDGEIRTNTTSYVIETKDEVDILSMDDPTEVTFILTRRVHVESGKVYGDDEGAQG